MITKKNITEHTRRSGILAAIVRLVAQNGFHVCASVVLWPSCPPSRGSALPCTLIMHRETQRAPRTLFRFSIRLHISGSMILLRSWATGRRVSTWHTRTQTAAGPVQRSRLAGSACGHTACTARSAVTGAERGGTEAHAASPPASEPAGRAAAAKSGLPLLLLLPLPLLPLRQDEEALGLGREPVAPQAPHGPGLPLPV
jgi:hypothetical protein